MPSCAEPRPRTRFSGVASRDSHQRTASPIDPEEDRQRDRADDVGERQPVARRLAEAVAGVPDEMAEAAEHMVDQRPAIAEEHDQPEP